MSSMQTHSRTGRFAGLLAVVTVALASAAGACGGGDSPTFQPPADGSAGDGPEHIHGLGVNPADGSLMIATHSGLFKAAPGSHSAERVGDRRQDTMGFAVVGPDRFIGSGHPDLRDDLPPLLGLIRSDDAGRSWEPVSLLGRADFHALRSSGSRIYGINAADGELLVSDDGGSEWAARTPSSELLDIAVAPDDPDHVVASGVGGGFVSRDAGATWRPLPQAPVGLLAWAEPDALFVLDSRARVHRSSDAGRSWRRLGDAGRGPAAFSSHGSELFVAVHEGEVKSSTDGGRSWRLRVAP